MILVKMNILKVDGVSSPFPCANAWSSEAELPLPLQRGRWTSRQLDCNPPAIKCYVLNLTFSIVQMILFPPLEGDQGGGVLNE